MARNSVFVRSRKTSSTRANQRISTHRHKRPLLNQVKMQDKLTKNALKDLHKIPEQKRTKIITSLKQVNSPITGKKLKGDLSHIYSIRIWPYRILYQIHKDVIVIKSIKHRQGAYK